MSFDYFNYHVVRESVMGPTLDPYGTEVFNPAGYLLQEDDVSRIILEDGSGFLLLEGD